MSRRTMLRGAACMLAALAAIADPTIAAEPVPVQTLTWSQSADDVSVQPAQFYSYYGPRTGFSFSIGTGYPYYGGYGGYNYGYGYPSFYSYGVRPGYFYSFPGGYTYSPPSYYVAPYYQPYYSGYYGYSRW